MHIHKYEIAGIVGSIAVMALILWVINGRTDTSSLNVEEPIVLNVDAVVTPEVVVDAKQNELELALLDAHRGDGTLVKLVTQDVREGTGNTVASGDTLTVHYVGSTPDGNRFDSSYERGEPYTFTLGTGKVMRGWEEGLVGMKVGGERILVIPAEMAYGNNYVGSIPPNTPLIYAIVLLETK